MKLKSCLQLDDSNSDPTFKININPSLCAYLPASDAILYTEGAFLLLNNLSLIKEDKVEEDEPIFEFESEIEIIRIINGEYILLLLKENNVLAVIKLSKELKVNGHIYHFKLINKISLNSISISKIIQIRSDKDGKVHLLTADSSLLIIENFVLFTRLNEQILMERFLTNQVIKKYSFIAQSQAQAQDIANEKKVVQILDFDFIPQTDEILTIGFDNMITWWKLEETSSSSSSVPSILNLFSVFNSLPKPSSSNQNNSNIKSLNISRILNESDRTINRILCKLDNFVLLEDSKHGRLLVLDIDLGLIIKIFKGYRNCSAYLQKTENKGYELLVWAGNRFTLEKFKKFPFTEEVDVNLLKINDKENSNEICAAAFDESSSTSAIFMYDPRNFQLKFYN